MIIKHAVPHLSVRILLGKDYLLGVMLSREAGGDPEGHFPGWSVSHFCEAHQRVKVIFIKI